MPTKPTSINPISFEGDQRVTHEFALCNGRNYHYVNAPSEGPEKAVVLLLHGFPDFWYGWRFVIPSLQKLRLRVIVPDLLGYGKTDKPTVPPNPLRLYGHKSMSADLVELLKHAGTSKVIVIGHDWGSVLAQRLALYHPCVVSHIALIAIPFAPINKEYVPLEKLIQMAPSFKYQASFVDPARTEERLKTREAVERFVRGMYRGAPQNMTREEGQKQGIMKMNGDGDVVDNLGDQKLAENILTKEDLEIYTDTFTAGGYHGPTNWYKTRRENFEDELQLPENSKIEVPALFIEATKDFVIMPFMLRGQERVATKLSYRKVETAHWAFLEDPEAVNAVLQEWFEGVVFGGKAKL